MEESIEIVRKESKELIASIGEKDVIFHNDYEVIGGEIMAEKVINEDELVGYIMRKTGKDHSLIYEDVRAVLDAEMEFLKENGIAEADTAEG